MPSNRRNRRKNKSNKTHIHYENLFICKEWISKNKKTLVEENLNETSYAAASGNLKILRLLHKNGYPWDKNTTRIAAEKGHLDCLQYAHEHGCPWHEETTLIAAMNGHLNCLQYAHEHGCPWHEETTLIAAYWAAINGHLDCPWHYLKPWYKNYSDQTAPLTGLLKKGKGVSKDWGPAQEEAFKYALEHGCPWELPPLYYRFQMWKKNVIFKSNIKDKWIRENPDKASCIQILNKEFSNKMVISPRFKACTYFAEKGNLKILQLLHNNGYPWNKNTTRIAAKNGHLDCLKYCHENGCSLHEHATFYATFYGHLDCLKYAHENGCSLQVGSTLYAAKNGHLKCLKYVLDHGCPWELRPLYYRFQMWKKYNSMNKIKEWKRFRLFMKKIIIFEDWKLSIREISKENLTLWVTLHKYFMGLKNYKNDNDFELLIETMKKHQENATRLEVQIKEQQKQNTDLKKTFDDDLLEKNEEIEMLDNLLDENVQEYSKQKVDLEEQNKKLKGSNDILQKINKKQEDSIKKLKTLCEKSLNSLKEQEEQKDKLETHYQSIIIEFKDDRKKWIKRNSEDMLDILKKQNVGMKKQLDKKTKLLDKFYDKNEIDDLKSENIGLRAELEYLKKENTRCKKEDNNKIICSICFEQKDKYVRFKTTGNCNHLYCNECSSNLQQCPSCRVDIDGLIKVHF